MKKLTIVTATRAEYGLLAPIIKKFINEPEIDVRIAVTGSAFITGIWYDC